MKPIICGAIFMIQIISGTSFSQEQASKPTPATIQRLMNPYSGKILGISNGTVTIDKGLKDGVFTGMRVGVEETGKIGDKSVNLNVCIKITEVRELECIGIIMDSFCTTDKAGASGELEEGMTVRFWDPLQPRKDENKASRVLLPGGKYNLGYVEGDTSCQANERPNRIVTIPAFYMDKTEVTSEQYAQCVEAKACPEPTGGHLSDKKYNWGNPDNQDHPINGVTWHQAKAFCLWAGGRLPTEAEWEYAARGGHQEWMYPWGMRVSHDQANYGVMECCAGAKEGKDQWDFTAPAGSFLSNGYGLYDIAGNVWEWVEDCYFEKNEAFEAEGNESKKLECAQRAFRGGAWYGTATSLRTSKRSGLEPFKMHAGGGFRCAQSLSEALKQ